MSPKEIFECVTGAFSICMAKQAAAKQTFVFLGSLTNEPPASAGSRARQRGVHEWIPGKRKHPWERKFQSQGYFYVCSAKTSPRHRREDNTQHISPHQRGHKRLLFISLLSRFPQFLQSRCKLHRRCRWIST